MARGEKSKQAEAARRRKRTVLSIGGGAIVFVGVALFLLNGPGSQNAEAAPVWVATSTDGEKLGSDALKGKVYAMDFFFLTCGICEVQLPQNKAMIDALGERDDFVFISVTADPADTTPLIEEHREKKNASWPHVRDTTGLLPRFKAYANPNIVFVDREGNIALTVRELADGEYLLRQAQRLLDGEAPTDPEPGETRPADHGMTRPTE